LHISTDFFRLKHELLSKNPLSLDEIKALITEHTKNQDLHYSQKFKLYTTQKLLEAEVSAICLARKEQNTCARLGSLQKAQPYIKVADFAFTKSQTKALQTILESKDRFLAIQGYAGTAKTTMLKVASSMAHDLGFKVKGVTAASSAANTLREKANIDSKVLPVVMQELQKAKANSLQKHIYILDEASTLNVSSTLLLMQEIKRAGSRLIMVGDKAQLPSVNNDKMFALLQDFGINTTVMDEILRQKNANLKTAVHAVIGNNISTALDNINLLEEKSYQERITKIAAIYAAKTTDERAGTLVFAPTNKARHDINQEIRDKLLEAKELDNTKSLDFAKLTPKPLNKTEQQYAQSYQKNEVIKLNQQVTDATAGYYTVLDVKSKHAKHKYLSITNEQGEKFNIGLKHLTQARSIERYDAKPQEFYKNELIVFTRNFLKDNIRNSETATIIDFDTTKVVFKNSKEETFELPKTHPALKHMDYGYAITDYKAQGKDSTHAIGLMDSSNKFATTQNHLYVQISRAVTSMTLVTDDRAKLIAAIKENDNLPKAALDIAGLTTKLDMHLNLAIHKEPEVKTPYLDQKTLELGEK
jgi:ATP-dependent exoDNAse (exonuclease V) alpha subunit